MKSSLLVAGSFLIGFFEFSMGISAVRFFGKGQGHGIEKHRTNVKKVTVQQTGQKQCKNRKSDKGLFQRRFAQEHADRLITMEKIGGQTDNSAASQKLNDGIVPPGRKK